MKKLVTREMSIPVNGYISYSKFFKEVEQVKKTLIENNANLDERIYVACVYDNSEDVELVFEFRSYETEEEYQDRLAYEEKIAIAERQREVAALKKKELQAKQAEIEERELYFRLKQKYEK